MSTEFELIAAYFAPIARTDEARGLRDDVCLVPLAHPGESLVASIDTTVLGVHLPLDAPPRALARKSLRRALSDLAANGAAPIGYMLALQAGPHWQDEDIAEFASALGEEHSLFDVPLLGGDTSRHPDRTGATITVFGSAPVSALRRDNVREGDAVFVTGQLGAAKVGLEAGTACDDENVPARAYWRPEPRLSIGRALHDFAHSAIDISDGLVNDALHIAEASELAIELDPQSLPIFGSITNRSEMIEALSFGDDYELLFFAPAEFEDNVRALSEALEIPMRRIGRVHDQSKPGVYFKGEIDPIEGQGFSHF
jgi:thiamine-monophosphate kinase